MDGARCEVSPRVQFRLNLEDPEQAALYAELMQLPTGKRNSFIVERLMRRDAAAEVERITALLLKTLHDAIRDASEGCSRTAAPMPAEGILDALFDTAPFSGGTYGSKKA